MVGPRVLNAGNDSAFTLDGTRAFLVGSSEVAVIDPGPGMQEHLRALVASVGQAERVTVLLTHSHADHAEAAGALARATGAAVFGGGHGPLVEGDRFDTDLGPLVALHTPGHSSDHFAFHWPAERALFAGDLLLGEGSTTWLGEYAGCIADYLASLDRLRGLGLEVVYPAHGPPIEAVDETLRAYEQHRMERLAQVRTERERAPGATPLELALRIYGGKLPEELVEAARMSVSVMVHHLEEAGRKGG